jgi:hypothetical protein
VPSLHVPVEAYVSSVWVSLQTGEGGLSQTMPTHGSPTQAPSEHPSGQPLVALA